MALARITDDVLFVIIDALKIEDIMLLGSVAPAAHHHDQRKARVGAAAFDQRIGHRDIWTRSCNVCKAHEPRMYPAAPVSAELAVARGS